MVCDGGSWMDPRWVSQRLVFPLIHTLSGKCYAHNISNGCFVSLISRDWLVARVSRRPGSETNGATESEVFVAADIAVCPCRWKVKTVSVKRCTGACQCVNLPVGRRPRQREERRAGLEQHCVTHNRLLSHHRARACILAVRNPAVTPGLDELSQFLRI